MSRLAIFFVQITWLIALGALAALYFISPAALPLHIDLGSIPIGVVWFGALGAVLISLTGIVEHTHDWDASYALWHISRPLVGASLAVVGVLIMQAGVLAVGTTPGTSTPPQTPGIQPIPQNLLYYLVAFLIGYREETFRELIKRLVDLILAPASPKAVPKIAGVAPASGVQAGGATVVISGSGFTGTRSVRFGSANAGFHVDSDSQITATAPAVGTAGKVTVTVDGSGGSAAADFTYT
jgi:IPT/TIG domain-containing protein